MANQRTTSQTNVNEAAMRAEEAVDTLRDIYEEKRDMAKARAQDAWSTSRDFLSEHPLAAVGCAFATGFLVAKIATRDR